MTSVNVAEALRLAASLYVTAVDSFAEEKNAARQLALLHSISLLVNEMQTGRGVDPLATWAREMLIMLEDCCDAACPDGDRQAVESVYQDISRLQEALGVPEQERAWVFEPAAASEPIELKDARPYAIQAQAVLPVLAPLVEKDFARDPPQLLQAKAALCGVEQALLSAGKAQSVSELSGYASAAREMLSRAMALRCEQSDDDKNPVWGLFAGLFSLLDACMKYAKAERSGGAA